MTSNVRNIVLVVALVLIGPIMFLGSRGLSLGKGFDRVNVGDTEADVRKKMGPPQTLAHAGLYLHGDTEYRYSSWPFPQLWVVSLKDGKVVEKADVSATH